MRGGEGKGREGKERSKGEERAHLVGCMYELLC